MPFKIVKCKAGDLMPGDVIGLTQEDAEAKLENISLNEYLGGTSYPQLPSSRIVYKIVRNDDPAP